MLWMFHKVTSFKVIFAKCDHIKHINIVLLVGGWFCSEHNEI